MTDRTPRMPSAERRRRIVGAAAVVFAREGYHGATTERVARAAEISQPYVVRMFGGKEALFLEVLQTCLDSLLGAFRAALPGEPAQRVERLGAAYRALADEDGVHLLLMQAFLLGADPAVGAAARGGFRRIVVFLRDEAGLTDAQVEDFLARGMLINVLLGLRMQQDPGPVERDLVARALHGRASPPPPSSH